jgi:hypothetical protein
MARRQVTEETAEQRVSAEVRARVLRTDRAVGNGQRARIADNTAPRWR